MSSSPAMERAEIDQKRKDKKDRKDRKEKKRKDKAEQREKKERERRGQSDDDDDEKLDIDRPSKKRKHSRSESRPSPAIQPESSTSAQPKKQKHASASSTALSRDQLLLNHTPFLQQRSSIYLPLSPAAQAFPIKGLCAEHLSPLLLTYYAPLRGVVLSYSDARISEEPEENENRAINREDHAESNGDGKAVLAQSINEYASPYTWLTATFTVFRPRRGTWLEGFVTLQNESLLGMVCYNYFNAVVEREELPEGWKWVDVSDGAVGKKGKRGEIGSGGGYFTDTEGKKVQGRVVFRVLDFEIVSGVEGVGASISVVGSLKDG